VGGVIVVEQAPPGGLVSVLVWAQRAGLQQDSDLSC